ncbi:MAG: hypothetical protein ACPGSO_00595 [Vicingaceae bacterium]
MSLVDRAREDARQIITNGNDWGVELTLITPDGSTSLTLNGLHTKHSIDVDSEGNIIKGRNAHVNIVESVLDENLYPYKSVDGEIILYNHRVVVSDATKDNVEYVINEFIPDEFLGVIVCILGDFE